MRAKRTRRTWPQRGLISLNVLGVGIAIATAWMIQTSFGAVQDISRVQLEGTLTPLSASEEPGERVLNVLLVGSDSTVGLDADDPIQTGRGNTRNGDVIIVAHLDERTSTAALLSIPRDLWVSIAGEDREAKINAAFALGGPATLIDTIEENFGIPINHYVNVDFAGFQGLVDAVDEVEVYFDAPMRDFNTQTQMTQSGFQMLESGCQALDGETALQYVRSRYIQRLGPDGVWVSEQASDLNRIKRQQDFLRRLAGRAVDLGAKNPFVFRGLLDAITENVALDQELTPAFLLDVGGKFESFEADRLESYSLPSRFGWVGTSSVLFTEEADAEPILKLFRGAASDDPSTVNLKVINSRDASARAADLVANLISAGFEPGLSSVAPLEHHGTEVRHGPDGRIVAELVWQSLGDDSAPTFVEVPTLVGRNVIVSVASPMPDDQTTDPALPEGDGGVSVSTTAPPSSGALAATTTGPDTVAEGQDPSTSSPAGGNAPANTGCL